ncbi:hypothetical protein BN77_2281 [Rhizobium mesoamericanum STM3625]|uniref:Uncharacterized protein n=1 Tax=Rhizobium mesoamericanum STM3625 TaxID=1211777 RepID=K0PMG9_9HYPH|nr:hypothetical protein BN77_2281 [Rhizobium mesoamericanum STM3625]
MPLHPLLPSLQTGRRLSRCGVCGSPAALSIVRLEDGLADEQIVAECQRRTEELKAELIALDQPLSFDGTIKSLITLYRHDKTGTLHGVKHSTRIRDYDPSLRVLEKERGETADRRSEGIRLPGVVHQQAQERPQKGVRRDQTLGKLWSWRTSPRLLSGPRNPLGHAIRATTSPNVSNDLRPLPGDRAEKH